MITSLLQNELKLQTIYSDGCSYIIITLTAPDALPRIINLKLIGLIIVNASLVLVIALFKNDVVKFGVAADP
jgi:hypothetical protein